MATRKRSSQLYIPPLFASLARAGGERAGGHVYVASSAGLGLGFVAAWVLAPRSSLAVRLAVGLAGAAVAGVIALRWPSVAARVEL